MIRNGFVSNSSSSSFVIVGKKENCIEDIEEFFSKIEKDSDVRVIFISGKTMCDGDNVFIPSKDQIKWLIDYKEEIIKFEQWRDFKAIISPLYAEDEEYSFFIKADIDIPLKEVGVIEVDKDYRSFDKNTTEEDLEEFFEIWRI